MSERSRIAHVVRFVRKCRWYGCVCLSQCALGVDDGKSRAVRGTGRHRAHPCLRHPGLRLHDLRHSHAALLVDLGYSIVAVAERLGDTVEVAMSTYSHMYPDKMDTLAVDLDRRAGGADDTADDLGAVAGRLEKAEKEAGKK